MNSTEKELIGEVERYALSYGMLDCKAVVIGYSGGADSSLLLHIMHELSKKHSIRLIAAHINHMMRAEDADSDEEFCRRECSRRGIEFLCLKENIPELAASKRQSSEECARNVRYDFFEDIRQRVTDSDGGKVFIATAHNATDNAETMIFNLSRGAALDGMCAIPPIRDGHIIRPLLFLSKERILSACDKLEVAYVTDKTNFETVYTRNRIRHTVLPRIRELNPNFEEAARRTSVSLRRDAQYLEQTASAAYKGMNTPPRCDEIASLHCAIASRVLCMYFEDMGAGYEHSHIEKCLSLLTRGGDFSISLIGKKKATAKSGILCVEEDIRDGKEADSQWSMPLYEGENILPDGARLFMFFDVEQLDRIKTQNVYKLFIHATIKSDRIDGVFTVRSRREGDTIKSGGHTHKLKKLMNEKKIPQCDRPLIPVVELDGEIVWVASVRVADSQESGAPIFFAYAK